LNIRRGHEVVHRLQNITAPSVFNPRAFFDGKKNMFSVGPLKMQGDAAEVRRLLSSWHAALIAHAYSLVKFMVSMMDGPPRPGSTRGQFRVRLTKVNDMWVCLLYVFLRVVVVALPAC
jgi:hypothetical protein